MIDELLTHCSNQIKINTRVIRKFLNGNKLVFTFIQGEPDVLK